MKRPIWNQKGDHAVNYRPLMTDKSKMAYLLVNIDKPKSGVCHIIDDRSNALMPYWLDHSWITYHIQNSKFMNDGSEVTRSVIENGDKLPTYSIE